MNNKNIEEMRKIIEAKKEKSKQQSSGGKRGPNVLGSSRTGIRKHKKGGLFDK